MASYDPQAQYRYTGTPFGTQPQAVPMPRPALDLGAQIPGLTGLNQQASSLIQSQLGGQLSPDTLRAIKDATATASVSGGMPGTGAGTLYGNRTARDIGTTSQQLQQQGLQNYNSYVPTVASTQTVAPALQADINATNSVNAAAPNPAAAQSYAENLFNRYLTSLNGGSKNGASGKNSYSESYGGLPASYGKTRYF